MVELSLILSMMMFVGVFLENRTEDITPDLGNHAQLFTQQLENKLVLHYSFKPEQDAPDHICFSPAASLCQMLLPNLSFNSLNRVCEHVGICRDLLYKIEIILKSRKWTSVRPC